MLLSRGLAALTTLALLSTPAAAQRFYLGASGGATHVETDYVEQVTREIARPWSVNTLEAFDVSTEATGTPGRLFAGIRLSEVFALEADYTRLGDIRSTFKMRLVQGALGYQQRDTDNEPDAFSIALLAHARLPHDVSLFGRAGVARTRLKQAWQVCTDLYSPPNAPRRVDCGSVIRSDVEETRPVAGLGIDWRFAGRFTLRASWDRYFGVGKPFAIAGPPDSFGEFDIDYFGVGLTYTF